MCGIVGYVGAQQAAPLLLEGLGRLEHRGYDSAGVAVLGPGKGSRLRVAKKAGRVRDLADAAAQAVRRQGRHRPHPVGDPRPGERRQRAPARRHQGRRRRRAQRDHRQRRRAASRAGRRRRRPGLRHRHRGARPPGRPLGGRDPRGQGGRGAGPGRGHLRARGPARGLPGPDRGGPQRQPADHRHRRQRDVRRLRPGRAGPLHDHGGAPRRRRAGHDHGRAGSRRTARTSARWRGRRPRSRSTRRRTTPASTTSFMHKEMLEQPEAAERVLRGRLDERFGTSHLGGLEHGRARAARDPPGEGARLRLGVLRRPDGRRAGRGAGPDPGRRRGRQRVPLPQPDHRAGHAVRRGEPVRRDHRHPARGPGDPAQGRPGRRPGQRRRLGDRPRVRRRHLPARRPRGRGRVDQGADQHVPRLRAARPPARPGPRPVDRRRPAAGRRAAAAARADRRGPRPGAGAGRAGRPAGRGREPVLRRPGAGLPGRPRGRAEVQGDQLPARRGLPDLRAQARPARADRARRCRPSRSSPTTS